MSKIIRQLPRFLFLTPTIQRPKGDGMLSWSFIEMQRDEAYSQSAQSGKTLIFQAPIIKNHCGSDWVTNAGDANSRYS